MKSNSMKKWLSLAGCIVLIAAMALCISGCSDFAEEAPTEPTVFSDGDVMGQGARTFTLIVEELDGSKISVSVNTDRQIVGQALEDLGIIKGENGIYGMFIKAVNGKTYEYEKDGAYWAFYIDGDYALTGVDQTEIQEGVVYMLKAERA